MDRLIIWLLFLIIQTCTSYGDELCYSDNGLKYCDHGCCADGCCSIKIWLILVIIGSVIGGLLLISFVICIICACVKKKGKTGRIIAPANLVHVVQPPEYFQVEQTTPYSQIQPPPYSESTADAPPPPLPPALHGNR